MTPSGGLCLASRDDKCFVKMNQKNIFSGTSNSSKEICCSFASLTNNSDVLIIYQPSRNLVTHGAPHSPQAHAIFSIAHHSFHTFNYHSFS